jgi:hypothetical protein
MRTIRAQRITHRQDLLITWAPKVSWRQENMTTRPQARVGDRLPFELTIVHMTDPKLDRGLGDVHSDHENGAPASACARGCAGAAARSDARGAHDRHYSLDVCACSIRGRPEQQRQHGDNTEVTRATGLLLQVLVWPSGK